MIDTIEKNLLKIELWQRAARHFDKAGLPTESAAAWRAAGCENEAIRALLDAGDRAQATPLLIKNGRYKEATAQARLWLKELTQDPERQSKEMVFALFNLAAALNLEQQPEPAHNAYDRAREKLAQADKTAQPLSNGKNWEALATYGVLIKRPDLIRLGYEKALRAYGQTFNLQRLRCAREYLEKITDDLYLCKDLQERIAEWQPQSNMKRERERLWQAISDFTG